MLAEKDPHTSTEDDIDCTDPALAAAEAAFLKAHPDYAATAAVDALRRQEYGRLDEQGHVYLDYTGGSLYAESQLQAHVDLLRKRVLGNPHSVNPTSAAATEQMESCRTAVMRFFNADPDEYELVFTANASGALKLVGESYPFEAGGQYLLTYDNHNSVNGIREFARAKGAQVNYIPLELPELRVATRRLEIYLRLRAADKPNLLAFPAQSNFSGVQHPLDWIELAHGYGWDVLLDAAAFAPTNRLDLGAVKPDFVDLSFYKMFGYPTGVGALLARKVALQKLRRPWFAGGTVQWASVNTGEFLFAPGPAAFEEGTVNYLSLPAVEIGLQHLEAVGVDVIHTRVMALTGWLLAELLALHHNNGRPLVQIYGPSGPNNRGATVALNLFDAAGEIVNHFALSAVANQAKLSIRTGAFCNPGGGETALQLPQDEHMECPTDEAMTNASFDEVLNPANMGALRVSLGLASNFADVYRFVAFVKGFVR